MPMNFSKAPPNMSGPPEGVTVDLVSTHQRLLIGACLRTTGPILELGCGWYSTPLLHEFAMVQGRDLWTIDNQEPWLGQFHSLRCDRHRIIEIGWWWDLLSIEGIPPKFGLVFVDNGQPAEREYLVRLLADRTAVFVLHDTEEMTAYGYQRILPMFRYQFTDKSQPAFTSVVSNWEDVSTWFKEIPKRGLTEDIT